MVEIPREFSNQFVFQLSPADVHAALTSSEYWRARLADGESPATLTAFRAEPRNTRIEVEIAVSGALLPDRAARMMPGGITFHLVEDWSELAGDRATGLLHAWIAGANTQLDATFRLEPVDGGTRVEQRGAVESKVPVFGRAVEEGVRERISAAFLTGCEHLRDWFQRDTAGAAGL